MTDARAAAEVLFTGPVERIVRKSRRVGSIHDSAPSVDLHAIAEEADRLMGVACRMQTQNSERDHGAKDDIIKSLAAIKRKLEGR